MWVWASHEKVHLSILVTAKHKILLALKLHLKGLPRDLDYRVVLDVPQIDRVVI